VNLESQILAYAREQAAALQEDMVWKPGNYSGGWWTAQPPEKLFTIVARATAAVELLRQYAGEDSYWKRRAEEVYREGGAQQSKESGARAVGEMLLGWVGQVEAGIVQILGVRGLREIASVESDLLGQVRRLIDDRSSHPAAPIMLCGAALEMAARGVCDECGLQINTRPSLMAWANRLREARLIDAQAVKEFEVCSGVRNEAAHGRFEDLSRERAGLMEQQTAALLLSQLSAILSRSTSTGGGTGAPAPQPAAAPAEPAP
jgi:hypothetical protein